MRAAIVSLLLAGSTLGCSWTRFDDVTENAPIALLNRPKNLASGFGASLAAARWTNSASGETEVTLLVGGAELVSGGAEFDLGTGDTPSLEASDTGHCLGNKAGCFFTSTPVALASARGPGSTIDLCFVDGAGVADGEQGVVVRCKNDVEYALPVPESAAKELKFAISNTQPTPFRFAGDRGPDSSLLASADDAPAVWYYPPLSRSFVEVPNPASSRGWKAKVKRTLAVARIGDSARLLAVAEPDQGSVRLFTTDGAAEPTYVGCLGGTSRFGWTMATGRVTAGDADDELVIADEARVYVLDGGKLAALPETSDTGCSLGALPEGSLITSFGCGSTKNISGCESSEFGAALAVGDLDGDGDGEVIVGAPSMTVRHTERAGALIIYDVDPPSSSSPRELYDFLDIAFISSAEQDDRLGASIAVPELDSRQLLVAGAPGGGKAALFYCPSFLPPELAGGRCR